jgi:hypothetical protein
LKFHPPNVIAANDVEHDADIEIKPQTIP